MRAFTMILLCGLTTGAADVLSRRTGHGGSAAAVAAAAAGQTLEEFCAAQTKYVEGCVTFSVGLVYTAGSACKEKAPDPYWMVQGDAVTLRKPVDTCTKNVIGNTVKFKCEDGVIMEHVYHDILDGSTCDSVPGACTCENEIVSFSKSGRTSSDPNSSGGLRTYVMPITNGCTEQFFGGMLMTWDDYCQPKPSCKFGPLTPFGHIDPKTTAVIDGGSDMC